MGKNITLKSRYKVIVKYIGYLLIGVGFFIILPFFTFLFFPNEISEWVNFAIPSLLAIILGITMIVLNKDVQSNTVLTLKEGGVIVVAAWILGIFFSGIPFVLGINLNFTQAVFEATSGWTTTGLSVIDVKKVPKVYLLWRSIMQFLGGVGLVVVMMASILQPYGFSLYQAEGRNDQLLPHVKKSVKTIMYIYTGYVIAGIVLYYTAGMNLFDAINHSMAALSTGGFSTKTNSIGFYNSLQIELVTIILMILGSINFATHFTLIKGRVDVFLKNAEIKIMLFLISITAPLVFYFTASKIVTEFDYKLRITLFEVVSAITTTGFSIDDFNMWNNLGFLIILVLMIIGGGTGSTAGGIKQYRVYLMFKSLVWNIRKSFYPKSSITANYVWRGEKKVFIEPQYIRETSDFIFIYLLTYFCGVLVFLAYGYGFRESLFEFASALGTVGLSIGITSKDAPALILWVETIGMFLGRLEFFVIIYSILKMFKDIKVMANKR